MSVNSLPKTVTRQRRGCDLNPGPLRLSPARYPVGYRATFVAMTCRTYMQKCYGRRSVGLKARVKSGTDGQTEGQTDTPGRFTSVPYPLTRSITRVFMQN